MIKSKIQDNIGQNISNKEKTALRKIIRAKINGGVGRDTNGLAHTVEAEAMGDIAAGDTGTIDMRAIVSTRIEIGRGRPVCFVEGQPQDHIRRHRDAAIGRREAEVVVPHFFGPVRQDWQL